jgi:uncharacterized membrane protein YraQ (UPF0718 family)
VEVKLPDHRFYHIVGKMMSGAYALLPLVVGTLFVGMAIYHWVEGLGWPDSFLNSSMLLGGMGLVATLHTTLGKWLAGFYALFAGLVVIVVAGAMLAPVVHHVLEKHHREMHAKD